MKKSNIKIAIEEAMNMWINKDLEAKIHKLYISEFPSII